MRNGHWSLSGLAILAAVALAPRPATATVISAPAALTAHAGAVALTETVGCGLAWRCGPYGCGWRHACWGPRHALGRDHNPWAFGPMQERLALSPPRHHRHGRGHLPYKGPPFIPYPDGGYDLY